MFSCLVKSINQAYNFFYLVFFFLYINCVFVYLNLVIFTVFQTEMWNNILLCIIKKELLNFSQGPPLLKTAAVTTESIEKEATYTLKLLVIMNDMSFILTFYDVKIKAEKSNEELFFI